MYFVTKYSINDFKCDLMLKGFAVK